MKPLTYNQLRFLAGSQAVSAIIMSLLARHLAKQVIALNEKNEKLWKMGVYLAHLAEENDIPLSEFDLIAFRELGMIEVEDEGEEVEES
jgi:hypothetical protein